MYQIKLSIHLQNSFKCTNFYGQVSSSPSLVLKKQAHFPTIFSTIYEPFWIELTLLLYLDYSIQNLVVLFEHYLSCTLVIVLLDIGWVFENLLNSMKFDLIEEGLLQQCASTFRPSSMHLVMGVNTIITVGSTALAPKVRQNKSNHVE